MTGNVNQEMVQAVRVALGMNTEGENTKPSQFQIFKGKSAMRVQLDKPKRNDQEYKVGCLYLQAAPSKPGNGQTGYDWQDKKVSVKIGVNDISAIVHGLRMNQNVGLFHEFGGDTKRIDFNVNEQRGGYFLSIAQDGQSGQSKVNVPLSQEEVTSFIIMLQAALPLIHNWT